MNVILYMAITPNGMVAKKDGDSEWVSEACTVRFLDVCRKANAVIMGKKTYDILYPNYLPLEDGIHIVRSGNKSLSSDNDTVTFSNKSAKDILTFLTEKGYKEVCVIGGPQTATDFMKENLIDEIYFDIEPLLFGEGMPIFNSVDFEYNLKLLNVNKLSEQTVQLHYQVIK